MTNAPTFWVWFKPLALLGLEIGLLTLLVAACLRLASSGAWRRTLCQAGIVGALLMTLCDLSGSARGLAAWLARGFERHGKESSLAPDSAGSFASAKKRKDAGVDSGAPRLITSRSSMEQGEDAKPERSAPEGTPSHPDPLPSSAQPRGDLSGSVKGQPLTYQTVSHLRNSLVRQPEPETHLPFGALPPQPRAGFWIAIIWLIGAAMVGARVCLAQIFFLIFRFRRHRAVTDPALVRRAGELAQRLGLQGRHVRIVVLGPRVSPVAFGLFRPAIGLPADFAATFDPQRQDAVLIHELAHLAAHDTDWCLVADLATIILWWHPGVWWLRHQLHLASELAADEASLLLAEGPRVLAECLVEWGLRLSQTQLPARWRVSGFRSQLGCRVDRLMHLERQPWAPPARHHVFLVKTLGPLAMVAIVLACSAWASPRALTTGDIMRTMQLNWKRSLSAVTLLTALNSPNANLAVGQPDKAGPTPATAPAPETPPPPANVALPGSANPTAQIAQSASASPAEASSEPASHESLMEAKLKQLLLPQVSFEHMPLSEVLRFLSEESIKLDPQKIGLNFLITPNFAPKPPALAVDPATGLPVPAAAPAESFDISDVEINFNLPLRHVTMKGVLDAIVKVANHPIEYSVEDYAVVFSPDLPTSSQQTLGTGPVTAPAFTPSGRTSARVASSGFDGLAPTVQAQSSSSLTTDFGPESSRKTELLSQPILNARPQPFNIDFGPARSDLSRQVGPAAAGKAGDYWNTVAVPWSNSHVENGLKAATGEPSPIAVEMINLGGSWGSNGGMGVKDPMLDDFNYPVNNQGGNSQVILYRVPAGKYDLYIYGHGPNPLYYGDYTVTVGHRSYGRKSTSHGEDAARNTKWVEGSQYVKFSGVKVGAGENIGILIRPGGEVTDQWGRTFADAIICGLQLIPVR